MDRPSGHPAAYPHVQIVLPILPGILQAAALRVMGLDPAAESGGVLLIGVICAPGKDTLRAVGPLVHFGLVLGLADAKLAPQFIHGLLSQ